MKYDLVKVSTLFQYVSEYYFLNYIFYHKAAKNKTKSNNNRFYYNNNSVITFYLWRINCSTNSCGIEQFSTGLSGGQWKILIFRLTNATAHLSPSRVFEQYRYLPIYYLQYVDQSHYSFFFFFLNYLKYYYCFMNLYSTMRSRFSGSSRVFLLADNK